VTTNSRAARRGIGTIPMRKYENASRSVRRRTISRTSARVPRQRRMQAAWAAMRTTTRLQQPLLGAARSRTIETTTAAAKTTSQTRVDFRSDTAPPILATLVARKSSRRGNAEDEHAAREPDRLQSPGT
jgi:hypothetical protein